MSELVLTIIAVAAIAISIWAIIYFLARAIIYIELKRKLGDAISLEEITTFLEGKKDSPTDDDEPGDDVHSTKSR